MRTVSKRWSSRTNFWNMRPCSAIATERREPLCSPTSQPVATSYSVYKGGTEIAGGSLGAGTPLYLPEGNYRVELHSSPPQTMPVSLAARDSVKLTLEKSGGVVSHTIVPRARSTAGRAASNASLEYFQ